MKMVNEEKIKETLGRAGVEGEEFLDLGVRVAELCIKPKREGDIKRRLRKNNPAKFMNDEPLLAQTLFHMKLMNMFDKPFEGFYSLKEDYR